MVLGQYGSTGWYWLVWRYWLVLGGTGSMQLGTACGTGLIKCFKPVYIEKSGDLDGCHHSGTTNEKGRIGLLSQWTMEG